MGRAPCCEKVGLRRGRWTAEEDEKLANYIKAHGEGSWRSLPKNAGLLRCGKSCRLRWINYLRADLKRGNISQEEEETIVKLHASFGNRWSLIASHLPGRTDNEIKNYWNSHLSRKIHNFHKIDGEGELAVTDGGKAADKTMQTVGKTKAVVKKNNNNNNININGSKTKKRKQEKIEDPPDSSTQSEEGESMVVDLEPQQTSSTAALCHKEHEMGHVAESGLLGTNDEFECDLFGAIEDGGVMSSCEDRRESGSLASTQTEGVMMGSSEDTEGGALVSSAVENEGEVMGLVKGASRGGGGGDGGGGEVVPVNEPSKGSEELVGWDLEGMKAKLWDGQEEDMWSWLWDNDCGELDFQGLGGDSGNQVDSMASWLFSDIL